VRASGIHHLGVAVEDLEEALATYERLFGAEVEHRATVDVQGVRAVSLRIGADVRATLAELADAGADLIDDVPREGLFGLEVAFVHPDSVHGVLSEVISTG
jgi:methylmalonyl-CoA/ethylmalonyl-CoA epimerase